MASRLHPTAQALLDVLRELDEDGTLESLYLDMPRDEGEDCAPLEEAIVAWRVAGRPAAVDVGKRAVKMDIALTVAEAAGMFNERMAVVAFLEAEADRCEEAMRRKRSSDCGVAGVALRTRARGIAEAVHRR